LILKIPQLILKIPESALKKTCSGFGKSWNSSIEIVQQAESSGTSFEKFQNPAGKISESSSENFRADPGRYESGSPPGLLKLLSWLEKFRNQAWKIYIFSSENFRIQLGKFPCRSRWIRKWKSA
jgi:hypothetical protein